MKYEELEIELRNRANKEKFKKDTSTPARLRLYFKNMINLIMKTVERVDKSFCEYNLVGDFADNYSILDRHIIVTEVNEKTEVKFEFSIGRGGNENFMNVKFVDGIATVNNRDLSKTDLEQFLIIALK